MLQETNVQASNIQYQKKKRASRTCFGFVRFLFFKFSHMTVLKDHHMEQLQSTNKLMYHLICMYRLLIGVDSGVGKVNNMLSLTETNTWLTTIETTRNESYTYVNLRDESILLRLNLRKMTPRIIKTIRGCGHVCYWPTMSWTRKL